MLHEIEKFKEINYINNKIDKRKYLERNIKYQDLKINEKVKKIELDQSLALRFDDEDGHEHVWKEQTYFDYWNGPIIKYIDKKTKKEYPKEKMYLANDIPQNNYMYKNDNFIREIVCPICNKTYSSVKSKQKSANINNIKNFIQENQKNEIKS